MERGSDKHGTRLDDELAHATRSLVQGQPVEARAEEYREQEGPAEGEPTPQARVAGARLQSNGAWPTEDELEARAELARHLDPSAFPARPEALVVSAEGHHAPGGIIHRLRTLPDGTYATIEEVWVAMGGSRESRA